MPDLHICPTCATEYVGSRHYCLGHPPPEDAWPDLELGEGPAPIPSKHYGKRTVEQADYTPPAPSDGTKPAGPTTPSATGATPKQRAFLTKLAEERGVEVELRWVASKAAASDAIDKLIAMPAGAPATSAVPAGPTDKQVAFLTRLSAERGVTIEADWLSSKAACSAALDRIAALPKVTQPAATPAASPLAKGDVHLVDGTYFRVHVSQRTGAFYAAAFDTAERSFVYERGAIAKLTPANRVTADEAAAFGKMYGRCVFCSRAIDTPESTAVGYGPICAAQHGLPWGTSIPTPEPTTPADDRACEGGGGDGPDGTCGPNALCSRHSWEYQRGTAGRAFNE